MVQLITTNYINAIRYLYNMDTEILENAGLTQAEVKIYLDLLKSGTSLAGEITKKTGLHRRSVYDSIDRMIEKGRISVIKTNNKQYFEAVHPQKFLDMIKEKENQLNTILPDLGKIYNQKEKKREALFYKGKQGLRTIFDGQIATGKEILILGASIRADEIIKFYFPHYDKKRVQKNIPVKMIMDESAKNNEQLKKIQLSNMRFIPKEYATPTAINIYGDNVAIILWSENPIGILIKEKDIADSYRKYFDLLWGIAKK